MICPLWIIKKHLKYSKKHNVSNGVEDIHKLPLDWFNATRQNYKQNQIEDLFISSRLPWIFFKDIAISDSEIKRLGITKLTPGIGC